MNRIEIIATGPEFIRDGIRGYEATIEELINHAEKEIHAVFYVISIHALRFIRLMKKKAEQGVKVNLVVNSLNELQDEVKEYLMEIQKRLAGIFQIISFHDLKNSDIHAKVLIVDRKKVLIGSANLSWGGITTNYEIGVMIEGEVAWSVAKLIDRIIFSEKE